MIPGNDDALRAIRLFASKIADAVIEGRALATEQDFTADKIDHATKRPAGEGMLEYTEYVDPKYAEKIMAESLAWPKKPPASPRKGPASRDGRTGAGSRTERDVRQSLVGVERSARARATQRQT